MGRPAKQVRRKKTSVRFSQRDEWFIAALVEQAIYGDNATDVLRYGLRLLIKKAQDEGRIPKAPKRSHEEIPEADPDDSGEAV